jgi:hypothetical protein
MIPPHGRALMAKEYRRYDRHGNYRGKVVQDDPRDEHWDNALAWMFTYFVVPGVLMALFRGCM